MAKSGKTTASNTQQRPAPAPVVATATPSLVRPEGLDVEMRSSRLRPLFWAIAGLGLVIMLWLSLGSGVNADDKFQNDYSTKLVNYYGTMGADTTALFIKEGNMHLYGGFFEIITGFTNKAFGLTPNDWGYHDVRHMWSAFFGWTAIVCAALLALYLSGWTAGFVTLILMLISPRFIGDSLMNPKDIPFAAGYIMAIYNMVRVLDALPRPNRLHLAGLVGGLAIALATRAGGLLPFAYLGLFAGLHFLLQNGGLRAFGNTKAIGRYALLVGGVAAAGYLLAVLFWPYALQSPLKNPFEALSKFQELEVKIRVLYDGINQKSDVTPWHYSLLWIFYTIPLAALPGLGLAIMGTLLAVPFFVTCVLGPSRVSYKMFWQTMVAFSGFFPVFYVIYKDSVIHDGWRHLTFVYPSIAVLAGIAWAELASYFNAQKMIRYGALAAAGLMALDAAVFIVRNPTMPYVYFNPIAGGTSGAYGQFETDYWGVSIRDGLAWMEEQKILSDTMKTPIVIATNMAYSAQKLTHKWGDKVRIKYLKWERRCDDAWDYALYPTRFIEGSTLRAGKWPPANTIHTITAGGAPILSIMKDNGKNCALGTAALKINDFKTSMERLRKEVENVPNNELAWTNLGQACLGMAQSVAITDPMQADSLLAIVKVAAEKAIEITPSESDPNNLLALYWIEKNDIGKAKEQFEAATKRDPDNVVAYYYLGLITLNQNNTQSALGYVQKAIALAPAYKPAYDLLAKIYEQRGDMANAQKVRQYMSQLK
jgi:tetratricopeptide (TPR) repeat protein